MATTVSRPGKFWAYVAIIVGGLLLLSGTAATIGYLGLPFRTFGEDILGPQLGQMAGMFLGLVCGALAVYHGLGSILNRASRRLKLPPFYLFWVAFAVVLGLGNVLLNFHVAEEFLFPPLFLLGAALPTVGVVAWVGRRLGWPITWRQGALALVSGSTLSILVTILLHTVIPYIIYLLVEPLGYLAYEFIYLFAPGGPGFLERLFFSPLIVVFLVITALEAPIPEEFAKAIGPALMGRRIRSERQAFVVGLASGAGFAILENMLYEGLYAQWSGWSWGGITLLRGIGSVLHPLGTAIIAMALFRERERGSRWFGRLARAYLLSVGLHTLWNGGFEVFVYLTGLDYYGGLGPSLSIYGLYVKVLLVVFLVALSLGLWWLLRRLVAGLAEGIEPDLAPAIVTRRALAGWAFACALVIIPIGAALGPAWGQIQAVVLAGPPVPTPTATPIATPTPTADLVATQQAQPTPPAPSAPPAPALRPQWKTYTAEDGLASNRVLAMVLDGEGASWFGTDGGVSRFDGENWTTYTAEDGLADNRVNAMVVDGEGALWFGTVGGVSRFDGQTWTTYTAEDGLADNRVYAIAVDGERALWFGTGGGVSRFDGQTWTTYTTEDGLAENWVNAIAVDGEGAFWFGTWGGGVSRFDGQNWTTYTEEDGLANNRVGLPIVLDADEALWFGTLGGGVSRFDGQNWTTYTKKDGLANNQVYAIALDADGMLWFGTRGGVSRFDGENWMTYSEEDGLANNWVSAIAVDGEGALWFGTWGGANRFRPAVPPTDTPVPLTAPLAPSTLLDMVHVPAGEFIMGSSDDEVDYALALCNEYGGDCERSWYDDEQPQHTVYLDAFYINKTEVTNAQYRACVEAGACDTPEETTYYDDADYAQHPVVYVSRNDADTYCRWAGKRLPTEAEWEKAARGTDGWVYPWGNTFDGSKLNFCDKNCSGDWRDASVDDGYADTAPVGSYPGGASPYGALDMAGNVWEWVADWYDPGYYSRSPGRNPPGPDSGEKRTLRGGSWHDTAYYVRCAARRRGHPDGTYYYGGFRCARGSE